MSDETNSPNLDPLPPEGGFSPDPDATTVAGIPADVGNTADVDVGAAAPGTAAPAPPGEAPASNPSWKTWVAVATTAAVVGAAAVFGISAATSSDSPDAVASTQTDGNGAVTPDGGQSFQPDGQGGPPAGIVGRLGGFGTISEIDGSTLTIEDQTGESTKVITSSDTVVTTSETGSVDDVKVGDTVSVVGTGTASNIAATRVTDDGKVPESDAAGGDERQLRGTPPEGANGAGPRFNGEAPGGGGDGSRMTRGTVKSVGDGTFTVAGIDGTEVTVTTSSDTTVTIAKDASVSDLKVGDTVMAQGEEVDGTITATRIREGVLGGPMGGPPGAPGGSSSSDGGSQ